MPQVRARPKYPGLRQDGKIDRNMVSGTAGIGCNKFFAEYGKKGYTGGILGFWCTHGICYGFHCIPDGEGRNDAFSALYTRWREAPKNLGEEVNRYWGHIEHGYLDFHRRTFPRWVARVLNVTNSNVYR